MVHTQNSASSVAASPWQVETTESQVAIMQVCFGRRSERDERGGKVVDKRFSFESCFLHVVLPS